MNKNDIDYKVCYKCDAPLPNSKGRLDYFNLDPNICDDCHGLLENESQRKQKVFQVLKGFQKAIQMYNRFER